VTLPTGRQLTIRCDDDHATIVELGGGLRSYVANERELLDTFEPDEPVASSRGQVLAPWPNRIDGGRYHWDGIDHQLPLTEPARGNASHGLLRFVRWQVDRIDDDQVVLSQLVLPQPGYPFSLAVELRYRVASDGLEVTTTATNVGDAALPWASGQHPYLAAVDGGLINSCSIELHASTYMAADERGIPLDPKPTGGTSFDLRGAPTLAELQLDTAFTDLARDSSGRSQVRLLADDGRGSELWVDSAYPWIQLFTGDTLAPARRRRGLAVEPMTAPANAFRSGADLIRLEPGESAEASWGLRAID
jgi:aldose 1-epimerase